VQFQKLSHCFVFFLVIIDKLFLDLPCFGFAVMLSQPTRFNFFHCSNPCSYKLSSKIFFALSPDFCPMPRFRYIFHTWMQYSNCGRTNDLCNISADLLCLLQDWAANYWVQLGAPKDKLVIGLATYGRCFTLADPAQNGLGAPVVGPCKNGTYTREAGFLSYYEVKKTTI